MDTQRISAGARCCSALAATRGEGRFRGHPRQRQRRQPRTGGSSYCGIGLPTEELCRGARPAAALSRQIVAAGGSALLLSRSHQGTGRRRAVHCADACACRGFPDSSWAEEALNNLGTHYILENEDEAAARPSASSTRSSRPGRVPSARPGSTAGGATRPATTPRRSASSRARPRPSRDPTTDPRFSTGRLALTSRTAPPPKVRADAPGAYRLRQLLLRPPRRGSPSPRRPPAEGRPASHGRSQTPAAAPPAVANDATIRLLLATGLYDDAINECGMRSAPLGVLP